MTLTDCTEVSALRIAKEDRTSLRFPTLAAAVTRSSGTLPKGYVETALERLDLLDAFAEQARRETDDRSTY